MALRLRRRRTAAEYRRPARIGAHHRGPLRTVPCMLTWAGAGVRVNPPVATDQKIGGSSPSEHAPSSTAISPLAAALLLTDLLTTGPSTAGIKRAKMSAALSGLIPDHVRVDPQRHRWVSMSQASRHHMHRHPAQQQSCGMDMPQIMQPCVREQLTGSALAHGHVMRPDEIRHQRRHRVRVNRTTPSGGEHALHHRRSHSGPAVSRSSTCRARCSFITWTVPGPMLTVRDRPVSVVPSIRVPPTTAADPLMRISALARSTSPNAG